MAEAEKPEALAEDEAKVEQAEVVKAEITTTAPKTARTRMLGPGDAAARIPRNVHSVAEMSRTT